MSKHGGAPRRRKVAAFVASMFAVAAFGLAVAPATGASAAIGYVQGASFTVGARTLCARVDLDSAVGAGDLLVGWFAEYNAAGTVQVSDRVNGAWTRASASETFGAAGGDIALYYVENSLPAPRGLSVHVASSGPAYLEGAVGDYSGVATRGALDQVALAAGFGTAVDSGPTAPVPAGDLVFSSLVTGGSPAGETPGASLGVTYAPRSTVRGGAAYAQDIISGSAGPQNGRATLATPTDWYAITAVFNPSETGPRTALHYAADGSFNGNTYSPGDYGFNLADVGSAWWASHLPAGTKALVYLGLCNGADATFVATVTPYVGNPSVFGYYLYDQPDPTGRYKTQCTAADLKAESDWIHINDPGRKVFITLMNLGVTQNPSYAGSYEPANTGIDLFGIAPYPCRSELNGCDYSYITKGVAAAEASGIPEADLVPVYQTFGGGLWVDDAGGAYQVPSDSQEQQILSTWASVLPAPAFDYAYSWGSQNSDTSLDTSPQLLQVLRRHNQTG